ncbi:MAG: hypothetical protein ABJN40_10655 [Sneathiella sp.]
MENAKELMSKEGETHKIAKWVLIAISVKIVVLATIFLAIYSYL